MKFYHIKESYIEYLRQFDDKVAENKQESRPYVGVVLELGGIKYYAPFSSPKPKHAHMKNTKDFRKINQGIYGAINFNNMIPVLDEVLQLIDIDHLEDEQYKRLLQNQYQYIRADQDQIRATASKLHTLLRSENTLLTSNDLKIKERCCNLELLEQHYHAYEEEKLSALV
jgi:protein AbiQ